MLNDYVNEISREVLEMEKKKIEEAALKRFLEEKAAKKNYSTKTS